MKKFVSAFLTIALFFSTTTGVFASNKNDNLKDVVDISQKLEEYSKETGIPLLELKEISDKPDIDIDQFMKDYTEAIKFPEILGNLYSASSGDGGNGSGKMTESQFTLLKSSSLRGNILVSGDQTHFGVNHGHAGIVTTQYEKTVEALGAGILSKECYLEGWWSEMYTAALLYHKTCTNDQQLGAARYAYNNLRGKTYKAIPSLTGSELNCATLVWQAYKSQGITLNSNWLPIVGDTCFPADFIRDSNLICKVNINW